MAVQHPLKSVWGLYHGSALCIAAEFLTDSGCTFSPLLKSFSCEPLPRAWIFNDLVLRPPKACEGNVSTKKGWLGFCFEYLLALYKQDYFISDDWSHCYSRTAGVLRKCDSHKLQDELLPCGTIIYSVKKLSWLVCAHFHCIGMSRGVQLIRIKM